jgi:hypothetical protein
MAGSHTYKSPQDMQFVTATAIYAASDVSRRRLDL